MIFPGETAQESESENGETSSEDEDDKLATLPQKGKDDVQEDHSAKSEASTQRIKKVVKPRSSKANPLASVFEAQRDARLELEKLRNATCQIRQAI